MGPFQRASDTSDGSRILLATKAPTRRSTASRCARIVISGSAGSAEGAWSTCLCGGGSAFALPAMNGSPAKTAKPQAARTPRDTLGAPGAVGAGSVTEPSLQSSRYNIAHTAGRIKCAWAAASRVESKTSLRRPLRRRAASANYARAYCLPAPRLLRTRRAPLRSGRACGAGRLERLAAGDSL
jgi:hypothetical protein